jgi:hypothetical protein
MTSAINLRQHNFNEPQWVLSGVKGRLVIEKAISLNFGPKMISRSLLKFKLCWCRWIPRVISFPKRYFTRRLNIFWSYWPLTSNMTQRAHFPDLKPVPFDSWLKISLIRYAKFHENSIIPVSDTLGSASYIIRKLSEHFEDFLKRWLQIYFWLSSFSQNHSVKNHKLKIFPNIMFT